MLPQILNTQTKNRSSRKCVLHYKILVKYTFGGVKWKTQGSRKCRLDNSVLIDTARGQKLRYYMLAGSRGIKEKFHLLVSIYSVFLTTTLRLSVNIYYCMQYSVCTIQKKPRSGAGKSKSFLKKTTTFIHTQQTNTSQRRHRDGQQLATRGSKKKGLIKTVATSTQTSQQKG